MYIGRFLRAPDCTVPWDGAVRSNGAAGVRVHATPALWRLEAVPTRMGSGIRDGADARYCRGSLVTLQTI